MHILLPSDVFPPGSVGGAAWSAHALAAALIQHGHAVTAIVPTLSRNESRSAGTADIPTLRCPYRAPHIPFVQNYYRHERLWHPLADVIIQAGRQTAHGPLLIHAQHVQATPAAVLAGQRLAVPVVATVRDHWPWDYFATGLHGDRLPYQSRPGRLRQWAALTTDLIGRLGGLRGLLALPAIPYMLAHMRRRADFLARADAVIAVSPYIARRLAGIVPAERLHTIPNMVDSASVAAIAATAPETPISEPFLLYVGKLERNKGAALLADIFRALEPGLAPLPPLLVAGTGALRPQLERELTACGVRVQFLSWVSHDEILRLMRRCTVLLFPSAWGEPLSRVLLEASALGVPIIAMPTGGTPDIIRHGEHGLLAATAEQFACALARLLRSEDERRRLAAQARRRAQEQFSVAAVLPRIEALYRQLQP